MHCKSGIPFFKEETLNSVCVLQKIICPSQDSLRNVMHTPFLLLSLLQRLLTICGNINSQEKGCHVGAISTLPLSLVSLIVFFLYNGDFSSLKISTGGNGSGVHLLSG